MAAAKTPMTRLEPLVLLVLSSAAAPFVHAQDRGADPHALQALREEIAIAGILGRLAPAPPPEVVVMRDVRVVDPVDRSVRENQSVVATFGVIFWVGDRSDEPEAGDAQILDGGGRFAAPGIADMHIHTESASSYLLNVAHGVTTVREMDGFPWMLAVRDAVNNERMLGPTSYVAGTILNFAALGGYAVIVRDAVTARRVVRQQAACGYDFIKVHNLMPARVFDPIGDESRRVGLDLVGHVPHHVRVRHAAEQGMRTMEHLKGWLEDSTLKMGDDDYAVAASRELWVTPTFYGYRHYASPEAMQALLRAPAARYAPVRTRAQWEEFAAKPPDAGFRLNQEALPLRLQIMRGLIAQNARFLAGTDAANYPFQTMGFALLDEMRLMRQAGLPEAQVWRAATTEAAAAMHSERAFGRIAPGMRADIVLSARNPLDNSPEAYAENQGVMVRGRWLERAALDQALAELAALYEGDEHRRADRARAESLAASAEVAVARGFVFNARILLAAEAALRQAGYGEAAERLGRLAIAPLDSPCAAITP